jgi:exopolyphosphatase / guanosine-5'-triphosphate,3'-diphosphate pyrophosphatase
MARHETLAAIDLGSNSFHLQIGRVVDGQIYPLDAVREVVRLGAGIGVEKRLDRACQARALDALAKFGERLRGFPRGAVRAVGTNALRVAKNAGVFLREGRQILGFPIEVISGREEARLIYLGVSHELPASREKRLVVDIGGGSTEFVVGDDHVRAARSVDVGCVRMTERHLVHEGAVSDPPTAEQIAAMRADIEAALDLAEKTVPLREAHTLVGLAGSVTTVSAIAQELPEYDSARIHHSRVSHDRVREITEWLLRSTHAERARVPSMHPGRVDVIGAGALVLLAIMERIGAREVVVSEHDILDGIAWSVA